MAVSGYKYYLTILICFYISTGISHSHFIKLISIPHNAKAGYKIANLVNLGQKFQVLDSRSHQNITKFFSILPDGWIITNSDIHELVGKKIPLVIQNVLGSSSWRDIINIEVHNAHSMFVFTSQFYEGHIHENQPPHTVVEGLQDLLIRAENTAQNHIKYAIVSGDQNVFKLIVNAGNSVSILSRKELDREEKSVYVLDIEAWLDGSQLESALTEITIFVDDVNDNQPYFEKSDYYTTISDQTPALSTIYFLKASDPDLGEVTYSVEPENSVFSIDPLLGHVMLNSGVKLISPKYELHVYATDPDGHKSKEAILHIDVDGVLRFDPETTNARHKRDTQHPAKEVEIPESYMGPRDLLDIVNSPYDRFSLKQPYPEMLDINRISGTVRLKDGYKLDYETQPVVEFIVVVSKTNDQNCKYILICMGKFIIILILYD